MYIVKFMAHKQNFTKKLHSSSWPPIINMRIRLSNFGKILEFLQTYWWGNRGLKKRLRDLPASYQKLATMKTAVRPLDSDKMSSPAMGIPSLWGSWKCRDHLDLNILPTEEGDKGIFRVNIYMAMNYATTFCLQSRRKTHTHPMLIRKGAFGVPVMA